nr:hypothetical protein StreXyl84_17380 [Streptomyces sp. Xyl84]
MVDRSATMTLALGVPQPCGAVGLNIPQAPKTAITTTPVITLGTTARSGFGAPSSEPPGADRTNEASMRRFAKV